MGIPIVTSLKKLTDFKWLNLFNVKYVNAKGNKVDWVFASRKENPLDDDGVDAVVIVPIIDTPQGKKLVVIKEYRVAIKGYEYGFPAGLIEDGLTIEETAEKELKEETGFDVKKESGFGLKEFTFCSNKIYSSPGLSDESCVMIFANVEGESSADHQESAEDIEVILMDVHEIGNLLVDPNKKVGAKAWGVLFYYSQIGEIR
jgi:ADP-ribose pyrophosphatase